MYKIQKKTSFRGDCHSVGFETKWLDTLHRVRKEEDAYRLCRRLKKDFPNSQFRPKLVET